MNDINRKSLEEEFDIEGVEEIEIETFRSVLNQAKELEDPNNVLTTVIEKAGIFLDLIERESVNGGMSARYMEVASNMINTISQAAQNIAVINSTTFNDKLKEIQIKQKDRQLDQKDKEIEIKEFIANNKQIGGNEQTNNILVTDRESIIKFLNNKETKQIN